MGAEDTYRIVCQAWPHLDAPSYASLPVSLQSLLTFGPSVSPTGERLYPGREVVRYLKSLPENTGRKARL